jgi:hypothetical protein
VKNRNRATMVASVRVRCCRRAILLRRFRSFSRDESKNSSICPEDLRRRARAHGRGKERSVRQMGNATTKERRGVCLAIRWCRDSGIFRLGGEAANLAPVYR